MPIVIVEMWEGRTVDQKRNLIKALTDAMVERACESLYGEAWVRWSNGHKQDERDLMRAALLAALTPPDVEVAP